MSVNPTACPVGSILLKINRMTTIFFLFMSFFDCQTAFWAFVVLLSTERYNMRALFDPESDALQQCLLCLHTCLLRRRPALARHLAAQGVEMSMFAPQWFLTLFIYRFPLPFGFRFWHTFLAEGVSAVVRVGVALLQSLGDRLLAMNFDAIIPFFNAMDTTYINEDEVFDAANEVDFAPAELALLHPFGFARPHLALSAADVAAEVAACEVRIAARAKEHREEAQAEEAERELERAKQRDAAQDKAAAAPAAVEALSAPTNVKASAEAAAISGLHHESATPQAGIAPVEAVTPVQPSADATSATEATAPLSAQIDAGATIVTESVTGEQSSTRTEQAVALPSSNHGLAETESLVLPSERTLAPLTGPISVETSVAPTEPATAAIVALEINLNANQSVAPEVSVIEPERPVEAASNVLPQLLPAVTAADASTGFESSSLSSTSTSVSASEPISHDSKPVIAATTPVPELAPLPKAPEPASATATATATATVVAAAAAAASEERPFACDLCEFRFARSNHLAMHRRVVHPGALAPSAAAAATAPPNVNAANAVAADSAVADVIAVVSEPNVDSSAVDAGSSNSGSSEVAAVVDKNVVAAVSIDAVAPISAAENSTAAATTEIAVENVEPARIADASAVAKSTLIATAGSVTPTVADQQQDQVSEVIAPASSNSESSAALSKSSNSVQSSKTPLSAKSKSSKVAAESAPAAASSTKKKKSMF
jgi:hypothetical protein